MEGVAAWAQGTVKASVNSRTCRMRRVKTFIMFGSRDSFRWKRQAAESRKMQQAQNLCRRDVGEDSSSSWTARSNVGAKIISRKKTQKAQRGLGSGAGYVARGHGGHLIFLRNHSSLISLG